MSALTPDISRVIKPAQSPQPLPEAQPAFADDFATAAENAIDALSCQFDAWMRADIEALRAAWGEAQKPAASPEDYRALYTAAHNIRGVASSYGFPAVSRLCGSLCKLLGATRPGEHGALINLHVEACRAAVAAGREGEGSQSVADAVCDALERRVEAKLAATGDKFARPA